VGDEALLFQPPQHGANRRILKPPPRPPRQHFANGVCGEPRIGPHQLHDQPFQLAQLGRGIFHPALPRVVLRFVTHVITARKGCQKLLRNGFSPAATHCRFEPAAQNSGRALELPFVIVPLVNGDNNQHSFDENLRLGQFLDGTRAFAGLLRSPY
jgi:hypothetical protein